MSDFARALGGTKVASSLLVLFIPSKDRSGKPIDQKFWVEEALQEVCRLFGRATAFPHGRGAWRDDVQGGKLLFDEPVVVQCYTSEQMLKKQIKPLGEFLHRMGHVARQRAVGLVINGDYIEIAFPPAKAPSLWQPKAKKRK